jgi:hypothetical protein
VVAQMVVTDTPENGCERLLSMLAEQPELARNLAELPKLSPMARRMILAALEQLIRTALEGET